MRVRRFAPRMGLVMFVMFAAALTVSACSSTTTGSGEKPAPTTSPSVVTTIPSVSVAPSTTAVSTSAAPSVTVIPAPSSPIRTATVNQGTIVYKIDIWAETRDPTCDDHAYGGPIVAYLKAHPCRGLDRLLATTAINGVRVGFNQASTSFTGGPPQSYETAAAFQKLILADNTGSFIDLLADGRRLPYGPTSLPSPDAFGTNGEDSGVTVWDAWYIDKPTPNNAPPLMQMMGDIFLAF